MRFSRHLLARSALAAAFPLCLSCPATAQDIVAVLSSDLGPYREALEGFQEAYGTPVPVWNMGQGEPTISPQTRVVVAFGGKAATSPYPEHVTLVYCMAPGIPAEATAGSADVVQVSMLPPAATLLSSLVQIQPNLKHLGVLWSSDGFEPYLRQLSQASARLGVQILGERVKSSGDLPDHLRHLVEEHADALWLAPDPRLVNAQNFTALKEFSWTNDVPFYAPNDGLVEKGAVASVSSSFHDIGRAAAQAASEALLGHTGHKEVHPEKSETTVNLTAANNSGLRTALDVLRKADKVLE